MPRSFLSNPRVFGRALDPDWKPASRAMQGHLRAAQVQHEVARKIREVIENHELDVTPIASELGVGRDQLLRKLRGEVTMSLGDIFVLARETQVSVTINVGDQ